MFITEIIWLPNIVDKLAWKHHVHPKEVEEILFEPSSLYRKVESGHREGENVYSSMGQTEGGRYLIIFFVYKKNQHALILSAREMEQKERNYYERKKFNF